MQPDVSERRARERACRSALIRWLDAVGATSTYVRGRDIDDFLVSDAARYQEDRFEAEDGELASAWLKRNGFVDGQGAAEGRGGLFMLWLTDAGDECAERFGGDPEQYLEAQKPAPPQPATTNTWNFFGPNNQVATGDSSRQEMNIDIGATVDQIAAAINGFAGLARRDLNLTPVEEAQLAELESAAIASVRSERPALEPLNRVVRWVIPRIEKGTDQATVATARLLATGLIQQLTQLGQALAGGG